MTESLVTMTLCTGRSHLHWGFPSGEGNMNYSQIVSREKTAGALSGKLHGRTSLNRAAMYSTNIPHIFYTIWSTNICNSNEKTPPHLSNYTPDIALSCVKVVLKPVIDTNLEWLIFSILGG